MPIIKNSLLLMLLACPYLLIVVLSLGSGWTFPHLLPDRLDFAPWERFVSARDGMPEAMLASAGTSLVVGAAGTVGGLLVGRAVRRSGSIVLQFLIYIPFVVSPVIIGIGLYDMMIRIEIVGTRLGVMLLQTAFAVSFASVLFSELWSPRIERLEQLVASFHGNRWAVWRHAIIPHHAGLIAVCFVQTALYSWLDYGIVSVIGGGHVTSVTTKLFGYLHEANVNQAAQSALVLLTPALAGVMAVILVSLSRIRRREQLESAP